MFAVWYALFFGNRTTSTANKSQTAWYMLCQIVKILIVSAYADDVIVMITGKVIFRSYQIT